MTQTHRWVLSAALWTAAVGLMIASRTEGRPYLAEWSLLVAAGAATMTLIAVMVRERLRNEAITNAVCRYADAIEAETNEVGGGDVDVPRIR